MVAEDETYFAEEGENPPNLRDGIEMQIEINKFTLLRLHAEMEEIESQISAAKIADLYLTSFSFALMILGIGGFAFPFLRRVEEPSFCTGVALILAVVAVLHNYLSTRPKITQRRACLDAIVENKFAIEMLVKRLDRTSEYG